MKARLIAEVTTVKGHAVIKVRRGQHNFGTYNSVAEMEKRFPPQTIAEMSIKYIPPRSK